MPEPAASSPQPPAPAPYRAPAPVVTRPVSGPVKQPLDPLRGKLAAQNYIRSGEIDKKYTGATRRVTAAIVAMPIALLLGWELYQRTFMGKEQKKIEDFDKIGLSRKHDPTR